jgi:predicted AlkP superfamily pyrophosphatase or phosphodiesterase
MRQPILAAALVAALAAVSGASPAVAGEAAEQAPPAGAPAAAPAATRPALVLAIAVDQFSADLFAQYRRFYTAGLARLQQGAVFPSGFQSHAATETCPGHATLLTGARPARSGIIANNWYDPASPRPDKRIYCAEDERDPRSSVRDPVVSAWHLKVPTLGEHLKAADRRSRNVAVSGKDRAAIMMGGRQLDAGYWWKGTGFTGIGDKLSPAVETGNAAVSTTLRAGAPAYDPPPWCAARDHAVPVGNFTIGTGRFAIPTGQRELFGRSPRLDEATVDLALRLVDELKLGADAAPDVLSVSLSASDYIGHAFGTEGVEMCIQQAALDRSIGMLLDGLDQRGIDYVVVLSADHGGIDAPERLGRQALPIATRADGALMPAALGASIGAAIGVTSPGGPLIYGDGAGGDYYVASDIGADQRARVIAALVEKLAGNPQVAAAYTADRLAAVPPPGGSPQDFTLEQRARASFFRGRSGDVVALLKRGVVGVGDPRPGYTSTHGSPWDYDRRVPILFWRKGVPGFEQPSPVETVDIAPTLAAILGLAVPEGAFDGRCLDIDGGPANTCDGATQ